MRFDFMATQIFNPNSPRSLFDAVINKLPLSILCFLAAGCASYSEPIIDTQGVNMSQYEADLADCKAYSQQIEPATGMAKGAAAGAATGAAIGAIGGDVGEGAGVGAVLGASKSGVRAADDADKVVKRCLRYRGYRVLN